VPATSEPIEILTADEIATLLRVDRKTVYEAAQRGELPHRRLGRRLLFERGAVLRWLRRDDVTIAE
jgi:excisionase family DNA binding protein